MWDWVAGAAPAVAGTLVGGIATFLTTRSANKQEAKAERERQRIAEIRDISIRFIRLISRTSLEKAKIEEMSAKFRAAIEGHAQGKDAKEVLDELGELDPELLGGGPTGDVARVLHKVFKEMGAMAPHISESRALLAEMRLIVPNKIVQIAEIANELAIVEQLNLPIPAASNRGLATTQRALEVFTNEIRREMGVDPFVAIDSSPLQAAQVLEMISREK